MSNIASPDYSSIENPKDIIERIREFTFRKRTPVRNTELLPTRANLTGLSVRFNYAENPSL